eukprot:scaffold102904_cov67-Phaeocystis_antarctica.AAC.1
MALSSTLGTPRNAAVRSGTPGVEGLSFCVSACRKSRGPSPRRGHEGGLERSGAPRNAAERRGTLRHAGRRDCHFHVSQSVSHYHTPSRELMAHTLTLLTRVRARRVSLDQGEYRVEGGVFYLLRFFLRMPSRDTPASSRTEASMAALVRSAARRRNVTAGNQAARRLAAATKAGFRAFLWLCLVSV